MTVDRSVILELLRSMGEDGRAKRAKHELPPTVDTDDPRHASLLESFGIDPSSLRGTSGR